MSSKMTTVKDASHYHNQFLDKFKGASNGARNDTLNDQAFQSFCYALGNGDLSISKVEADYTDAAKALQMDGNGVKSTLRSALKGANPRDISAKGGNTHNSNGTVLKTDLTLAPIYTALEDYATAHGVPVKAFEDAKWTEGAHNKRKCLLVPCEDGVTRARFLDGNSPKWMPIKKGDTKITPCWYGFNGAIAKAKTAKHKTIVMCNGQPSVVAAQHYGIPALAQTDGENKTITTPLMRRLACAVKEHKLKIMLAYDGDDTGRASTDKIKTQLQKNSITPRIVHFGGDDGYDLADYCKQHKTGIMDRLLRLASYNEQMETDEHKVEDLAKSMDSILGDYNTIIAPGNAMPVPFKSFHKFGGYAYMTAPGKMAMIMAPSGHGKTSFLETWADYWLKIGTDVLFYSPEWDAMEIHFRRVQRNGGATYDQMRELILYRNETTEGITKPQRMGRLLSPDVLSKTHMINNAICAWPGQVFSYKAQRVTETTLELMSKRLHRQRRDGRRVGVAVFDYMQLMRTKKEVSAKNTYEVIGDMLKDWCVDNHVFGMVGMQVKKSSGQSDGLLGMYDAQWCRPDIFNLIVTLNIKEKEVFVNGVGHMEKATIATANICKNSTGQIGEVQLKTNFKHLAWEE